MPKINCILLVDDNEGDNVLNAIVIEDAQVSKQIKVATDGKEALAYLMQTIEPGSTGLFPKPDLIFLDLNMPGMDGFEFLREYEKLNPGLESIIVILTSSDDPVERSLALSMKSVSGYLNKPLESEILLGFIERCFDKVRN